MRRHIHKPAVSVLLLVTGAALGFLAADHAPGLLLSALALAVFVGAWIWRGPK